MKGGDSLLHSSGAFSSRASGGMDGKALIKEPEKEICKIWHTKCKAHLENNGKWGNWTFLSSCCLLIAENGCTPPPQGRPEIKYLLQGGMPGKGSLLAKPSGPLGTSLAWRTLFWAYVTITHIFFFFFVKSMAHVPCDESSKEKKVLSMRPQILPDLKQPNTSSFLPWINVP